MSKLNQDVEYAVNTPVNTEDARELMRRANLAYAERVVLGHIERERVKAAQGRAAKGILCCDLTSDAPVQF